MVPSFLQLVDIFQGKDGRGGGEKDTIELSQTCAGSDQHGVERIRKCNLLSTANFNILIKERAKGKALV